MDTNQTKTPAATAPEEGGAVKYKPTVGEKLSAKWADPDKKAAVSKEFKQAAKEDGSNKPFRIRCMFKPLKARFWLDPEDNPVPTLVQIEGAQLEWDAVCDSLEDGLKVLAEHGWKNKKGNPYGTGSLSRALAHQRISDITNDSGETVTYGGSNDPGILQWRDVEGFRYWLLLDYLNEEYTDKFYGKGRKPCVSIEEGGRLVGHKSQKFGAVFVVQDAEQSGNYPGITLKGAYKALRRVINNPKRTAHKRRWRSATSSEIEVIEASKTGSIRLTKQAEESAK